MAAFDPDAYLAKSAPRAPAAFDPDAYLRAKTPPPGMRAVRPGEIPTESGFAPEPQPEVPRTFLQRAAGTLAAPLDVALTLGSAVSRGVAAPIYGLVSGRGEAGVEQVLRGVRQPQTPEARAVFEAAAPALSALPPVIGTGAIPQIATAPVTRTIGTAAAATAEDARRALASREAARTRQLVTQSQQLGPKVDAAKLGREVGLAAPPQQIDPSRATQAKARIAGERTINDELSRANAPKWNEGARQDLGLQPGARLDENSLVASRNRPEITQAYEDVANVGPLRVDESLARDLDAVRPGQVYGASAETAAVNNWITNLTQELSQGADARTVLRSVRQMRDEANSLFKSEKVGQRIEPVDMAMARAKIGAADALEELIARNVQDRTVLYRFQDARKKLAQTYDYERALDFATGDIDPQALAKLASAGKPLSGNLEKMATFAANFPEVSTLGGTGLRPSIIARAGRGTAGGALGSAMGGLVTGGSPFGFAVGAALGGIAGERLGTLTARGMASPAAQARLAGLPDYRLPVNQLSPVGISTNRLLPTLYNWERATAPDWVPGRGGPEPTFGVELPTLPQLGLSTAEETMANVQRMREGQYMSDMLRAQAAERAAQEAAQSPYGQMVGQLAAGRVQLTPRDMPSAQFQRVQVGVDAQGAPVYEVRRVAPEVSQFEPGAPRFGRTGAEGQPFEFSDVTGRFYPATTPPVGPVVGGQTSLESGVQKLGAGTPFAMTPEEQIAFSRASGQINMLAPEGAAPVNELIVPTSVGGGPRRPAPPPPEAPPPAPPPPKPPAGGGEAALSQLFARLNKGYEPSAKQLNDVDWLQGRLAAEQKNAAFYSQPGKQPPPGFERDSPALIAALEQRIAALGGGAGSPGASSQQALEAALKRTFGYEPDQVKRHFGSRAKIERGISQIEMQIDLAKRMPETAAYGPQGLEELLAAFKARLKEMK